MAGAICLTALRRFRAAHPRRSSHVGANPPARPRGHQAFDRARARLALHRRPQHAVGADEISRNPHQGALQRRQRHHHRPVPARSRRRRAAARAHRARADLCARRHARGSRGRCRARPVRLAAGRQPARGRGAERRRAARLLPQAEPVCLWGEVLHRGDEVARAAFLSLVQAPNARDRVDTSRAEDPRLSSAVETLTVPLARTRAAAIDPERAVALALLATALVLGLATAADYGVTIDEFNANDYGPKALAWYTSGFTDRSHFETVEAPLWYYGPWFQMLTAAVQSLGLAGPLAIRHALTFAVGLAGVAALYPVARLSVGRWAG